MGIAWKKVFLIFKGAREIQAVPAMENSQVIFKACYNVLRDIFEFNLPTLFPPFSENHLQICF